MPADLAEKEVERAKKLGATHLGFFVDLDGLMIYPSRFVPQDPRLKGRDLLGELVAAARRGGLRLIAAWMGLHVQTYLLKQHPDWELLGLKRSLWTPDGLGRVKGYPPGASKRLDFDKRRDELFKGMSSLCINSPHRDVLLGQFEEVIRNYNVDGIYQDGLYFPEPYCFCRYCREKYRRQFGQDMSLELEDPKRGQLRRESLVSFVRQVRELIDGTRPETVLFLDCHGTIIGMTDGREMIDETGRYVDAFMLECYSEVISEHPYYVGMETDLVRAETNKTVISPKWIAWNPDCILVPLPSPAIKLWAWQAVMREAVPVFLDQRVTDFAPDVVKMAGRLFADVRKVQAHIQGARQPRYAALLHSMQTKARTMPYRPREHRQYFEGWWTALEGARVPFDVITERDILEGGIQDYRVLILPNVRVMSDAVVRAVRRYVRAGGGLVLTGCTSLEDENGRQRPDLALGKLAGIRFRQLATTKELYGRRLAHYYRVTERHPIAAGLGGTAYAFSAREQMTYVTPRPGARTLFHLTGYDEALVASDKHFVSYPTDRVGAPAVVAHEDTGRVVAIPAPLDATYWEYGWPEAAEILVRSAIWAARRKPLYHVDAPPCVRAACFQGDLQTTCLLLNTATNPQYSIGFPGSSVARTEPVGRSNFIQYVVPIADVTVTLPVRTRPKRVHSVTGQKLRSSLRGRKLTVRIPKLAEYEAIFVEK